VSVKKNKVCFVFGAGEFDKAKYVPGEGDYVIAADGGYKYAMESGITPDYVLGDFDSLGYVPEGNNVEVHPVMKDDTDMMMAVKKGMAEGCDIFVIYGGMGGRLAHTIGNIQVLAYLAKSGKVGFLTDENQTVTVVSGSINFTKDYIGMISVFAHGDKAVGISEKGLLYEVEEFTMECDTPIGVSNEFKGEEAIISLNSGLITVVWEGNYGRELPTVNNIQI